MVLLDMGAALSGLFRALLSIRRPARFTIRGEPLPGRRVLACLPAASSVSSSVVLSASGIVLADLFSRLSTHRT